ncbi:hypothetical protein FF2_020789 [Malus domestica]
MKQSEDPGAYRKILLASVSAMVAETTTFPVDLTKTRLQLHGESVSVGSTGRTNAFRVTSEIVREQGPVGLYKGLSPAILRHLFYTPIRIVGYEQLRSSLKSDGGSLSLPAKALSGGISGVVAQLVASPADLVKVRMQADGRTVAQGMQPRYSGCFDALNKIVRAEGVGGLWKGVFPNVQRAFLVNMGELACLSATALSCPADVVKTRMMNQSRSKEGKIMYNNSYDCLVKTVKVEGLSALWKGFFPTWARLGPWQFVFWVSYEKFRQIAGFSSF